MTSLNQVKNTNPMDIKFRDQASRKDQSNVQETENQDDADRKELL